MTDTYVYADGSNVLINKMGLRNRQVLQKAEYRLAATNAPEALAYADKAASVNERVWRGIHRRLFGELYGWAGKFRTVDLSKGQTVFAPPRALHGWADKHVFPEFQKQARAAGSPEDFALALAKCWAELNFLHPFREGNGRATQILVTALARRHGLSIDWRKVDYKREIAAAKASIRQDYAPYAKIVLAAAIPGRRGDAMIDYWPGRDREIGQLKTDRSSR